MPYLLYSIFLLLSLGHIGRISLFDQEVNLYLHEVVMAPTLFYLMKKIGFSLFTRPKPHEKAFYIFILVLFVSLISEFWKFSMFENTVGFLYLIRLFMYGLFFLYLLSWVTLKKDHGTVIKKGVQLFMVLTIIFSIAQYFLYPELTNLAYLGWDKHVARLFGLFFDTTASGIILALLFFYSLERGGRYRWFMGSVLLILLLLTYSRISYVAFTIAFFYSFAKKLRAKTVLLYILIAFVFIMLLPRVQGESTRLERLFTIQARLINQQEGLVLWLKRPFLGHGYDRLRYVRRLQGFDHSAAAFSSSFVTLLAASGIIGFGTFLYFMKKLYDLLPHLGKTALFVILIASLFDNIILHNLTLMVFIMVCAASISQISGRRP
ncbi:MAG TPA: O-antigen ligase family protein [Patescibacteria group bacterium]|nr:O-antigen ligase family protein [Patescibacteria group bacterium]